MQIERLHEGNNMLAEVGKDSLISCHRMYPNDSFHILSKRLHTDLNLYKIKDRAT